MNAYKYLISIAVATLLSMHMQAGASISSSVETDMLAVGCADIDTCFTDVLITDTVYISESADSATESIVVAPKDPGVCDPDPADILHYGKRNFGRAAMMVAGFNVGVWAFDWFAEHQDYAYINWSTIEGNFKKGFVWDNDRMGTNMFLHPYHGSLYYNSARSNGFNFWQSGLFALGGSAMWELVMENENPSINDIIATPIGGMAIGEVTYRASDRVIRDDSRGWERFGRELAVFLIAPTRSLTRLITGDAWHTRSTSGRMCGNPPIVLNVSAGVRALQYDRSGYGRDRGAGFTAHVAIAYGDRYELRSSRPYDYFRLNIGVAVQRSQPLLTDVNIMGRLISREILDTEHQQLSVGMYQHFDFYDSDTLSAKTAHTPYKLAVPASVGCGVLYRIRPAAKVDIQAFTHVNGIILGGVLTDYYDVCDRNYNLGSGFGIKSGLNFDLLDHKLSIGANYEYYRLFTWGYPTGMPVNKMNERAVNTQGDDSVAYFGKLDVRTDIKLTKDTYLTLWFCNFARSTRYRDFEDVKADGMTLSLMLTHRF